MVSVSHLITQGALPNPEILARYEQISPGTAERIISMAEDEARHRRCYRIGHRFYWRKENTAG